MMKPWIGNYLLRLFPAGLLSALVLGLMVLALAVSAERAAPTLALPIATTTPNPRCGVAGANPDHLQALGLSVGTPEPGGYIWDNVTPDNAVQMVRACRYYDAVVKHPRSWHPYCYNVSTGAIWNGNEPDFTRWVSNHRGLTWIIGNEPDDPRQDGVTRTEQYAQMYHYFYELITRTDHAADIAIGGLSHITGYVWADNVLTDYQRLYSTEMPIDVWTIHHYHNDEGYDVDPVKEPIHTWTQWIKTTRNHYYVNRPIWLTEWGKNGWLNPDLRYNHIPDDVQHPGLASLMLNWARWMETEGEIDRWFWFISEMGDWNRNMEFDIAGWLFQPITDFITGTADAGSTITTLVDAELLPPTNNVTWTGATLFVNRPDWVLPRADHRTRPVVKYYPVTHALVVTPPFPGAIAPSDSYSLFQWSYYNPPRPNFLGHIYKLYCNPGLFPYHIYLPLVLKDHPPGSAGFHSGLFVSPLSPPAPFDSPLPTPTPFVSPLPTPAPPGFALVDDFEYDDSPTEHGWHVLDPGGMLRALNYKSDSNMLYPYGPGGFHRNFSFTYPGDPASGQRLGVTYPFLSFQVADMDGWWVAVQVRGDDGQDYRLLYVPQFGPPSVYPQDGLTIVQYNLGAGYIANGWHAFGRNLDWDLRAMVSGVHFESVERLFFYGPVYLDNVILQEPPFPNDTTPPTTTLHVRGTLGNGDWYLSPVTVSISASDEGNGSGVSAMFRQLDQRGWETHSGRHSLVEIEGLHLLEGYAVDQAGNVEEVKSAAFGIDRTRPAVRIISPLAITYTQSATFTVAYTASDAVSGIQTITATLDGAAVSQGQVIDTLALAPGPHTLAVTATDAAGWTASASRVFTVEVTLPGLVALKHWLYARGEIYGPGVGGLVTSLDAKLDKAQRAIEKGDVKGAVQRLQAFIAEVQAQASKHITPQAAKRLIEAAQWIMAKLQNK